MTESRRMVGPGELAPPFRLPAGPDERLGVEDFRGVSVDGVWCHRAFADVNPGADGVLTALEAMER
jgi:hypothetical protein